ncbi:MAG: biotin/lipoate A/B protein ligase family protein [Candidatus Methylomirabilia bacterium]
MTTPWRLLVTAPLDGATNMAVDEALLRARIGGSAPPTLRFFSWLPPTVSLGYGQWLDGRVNVEACRRQAIGLVRRPTGGSAIYHDTREREVTYSVTAAASDFPGAGDLLESYRWIGSALAAGLTLLGARAELVPVMKGLGGAGPPAFCFARTGSYEIEVAGRKLVGSAQRRQGGAFLQHGSVLLGAEAGRLQLLFPGEGDPLLAMTTLEAQLGRRPSFEETVEALTEGFRRIHHLEVVPGDLSREESDLTARLVREKYGTESWTRTAQTVADSGALLAMERE